MARAPETARASEQFFEQLRRVLGAAQGPQLGADASGGIPE